MSETKTESQAWTVGISPRMRWGLFHLLWNKDIKVKGLLGQGRLQRARRAFGLVNINDALTRNRLPDGRGNLVGVVNSAMVSSEQEEAMLITKENIEVALEYGDKLDLDASILDSVWPAMERLQNVQAGTYDFSVLAELPVWDKAIDTKRWDPVKMDEQQPGEITCPSCGQRFHPKELTDTSTEETPMVS